MYVCEEGHTKVSAKFILIKKISYRITGEDEVTMVTFPVYLILNPAILGHGH